jgi:hypothetical protein
LDLAVGTTSDLSAQFRRPADAQCCLRAWRAPLTSVDWHGDGFGPCKTRASQRGNHFRRRYRHSFRLRLRARRDAARQRFARCESTFTHFAISRNSAVHSSVKIVAAVLREVDYLRRNLGQVILAAAILDDTIGWTILAFIGGLVSGAGEDCNRPGAL